MRKHKWFEIDDTNMIPLKLYFDEITSYKIDLYSQERRNVWAEQDYFVTEVTPFWLLKVMNSLGDPNNVEKVSTSG